MTRIKLSRRLQGLANFVPLGSRVADIGSDHGLLVSYLVLEGISPMAVAGEVKTGPYNSTKRKLEQYNLNELIDVRLGYGISVIKETIDVVIIAGMGGELIAEILENGRDKLQPVQRLILQPNVGEYFVRRWLYANDWEIIDEEIIEDKNFYYELIVAEKNGKKVQTLSNLENRVGPINLLKKDKLLVEKWKLELKKQENVIEQIKTTELNIKKLQRYCIAAKEYRIIKQIIKSIES